MPLNFSFFYDDFETANPLGSKRGVHKLGGIYFTIRNFSPKCNSCLTNIHLCALFHAQDVKTYGFDMLLAPIVQDLRILESKGIYIPLFKEYIHGSIVQVTGDNLAIHSLFGFVESFGARYCCRFCLAEKDDFQTEFSEDSPKIVLRTKEMHESHCQLISANPTLPYVFGVKKTSLLNSLQYFHTSDHFSVDIMHDILEGVAQYEMKLLLHYLQTYVTPNNLALRIQSFNYGFMERNNKPPAVNLSEGSNDLGLNAIQSWCLLRNMPLIFGDLISTSDEHWYLLLLLLQIVNIAFSPVLTYGATIYLKHLIEEHHRLFKQLFPSKRLLPKHHLMIHYPHCIRSIGPILHSWCMRYEGKHNFFKKQLSFKNITKTLATKHQNQMAYIQELFNINRLDIGPGSMVSVDVMEGGREVANLLPACTNVMCVRWVKHQGFTFRTGLVICGKVELEMPQFYQISSLIVKDDIVLLVTFVIDTVCFDEHFHAYRVVKTGKGPIIFFLKDLEYYRPFDMQVSYGIDTTNVYIVPYCLLI